MVNYMLFISIHINFYAGYKQYNWWIHNHLGKGVLKVIRSGSAWGIRNFFLSGNQEYRPFTEN